ncbi:hypothetical protein LCGC14_0392730 [marine sediment metagenome]|uniref:Uncharacterized protein n=1 Tax=marine sediment metagenome TaxID=412755 RepID=A0A0F9TH07_9ZZZZ
MTRIPEFVEELQGRPASREAVDTSTGQSVGTTITYITAAKLEQIVICYEETVVCHNGELVLK